jgi:hypothetical protein
MLHHIGFAFIQKISITHGSTKFVNVAGKFTVVDFE